MRDLEKLWLISIDLPDGASYRHTRGLRAQLVATVETTVGLPLRTSTGYSWRPLNYRLRLTFTRRTLWARAFWFVLMKQSLFVGFDHVTLDAASGYILVWSIGLSRQLPQTC